MRFPSFIYLPILLIGLFLLFPAGCVDKKGMVNPITTVENAGDINDNDIPHEIADAVMFSNYFMTGTDAFDDHPNASMTKSDVNGDGNFLGVADLVSLIRHITGDYPPYPIAHPNSFVRVTMNGSTVSYDSPTDIGAIFLLFWVESDFETPLLEGDASSMDIKYQHDNNHLRVLIYNIGDEMIDTGENELVTIPGQGILIGAEMATYDGFPLETGIRNLPPTFELGQNYPNPFSASTTIAISLPEASEWNVTIHDVIGNVVKELSGYAEAGVLQVVWDGNDANGEPVNAGVYFYRATVGDQTIVKRMMLLR